MSYLVSELLIKPVLRQARRFSSGFATTAEPDNDDEDDITTSQCSASLLLSLPPTPPQAHQWRSRVIGQFEEEAKDDNDAISSDHTADEASPAALAAPPPPTTDMAAVERLPPPPQREEEEDPSHRSDPDSDTTTQHDLTPPESTPTPTPTPSTSSHAALPEDDGMAPLRRRIIAIQSQDHLGPEEKAVLMHQLLMEGYNRSQVVRAVASGTKLPPTEAKLMWEQALATGPLEAYKFWNHLGEGLGGLSLKVSLGEDDLRPTFVPPVPGGGEGEEDGEKGSGGASAAKRPLGCEHYRRNVKMQCATCGRWYTCRLCHDVAEDHQLPRRETAHMLCMLCGCAQRVGDTCIKCGTPAARYYCGVCKLWNDDPDKNVYHCDGCGICRVGQGLGKDFYHCNKCMACIAVSLSQKHKCIERSTDRDCPICGDNMFQSVKRVIFMDCGHSIHHGCFEQLLKTSYRCPLCNKSVVNMEIQFRNYDAAIQNQPMPAEYRDARAVVSCNDCSAKSQTAFHWLGLRCSICHSYNTVALDHLNMPGGNNVPPPPVGVAALAVGAGAGAMSPSQRGMDALPSPPLAAVPPPTMTWTPTQHHHAPPPPPQPSQPSLPHETSGSSTGSASTNGLAFSPDGMDASPPPLPVPPVAAAAAVLQRAVESDDEDGFWDGDVLGNILSSPGESDEDHGAGSEVEESESESGSDSEDGSDGDGDEEEEEDDDKDEELMLPGHR